MKISFFLPHLKIGGVERSFFILAKTLEKRGHSVNIITVGIGSSANCDGQVLVIDDLIGLSQNKFRFVKKYANIKK